MSDFPSLGNAGGQQAATNAGAFGFFDQNAGGGVVGGGAMNESQGTTAPGGDLFSAGQTDLFAGGDGSAAMLKTATNGDGDAAAAEVVASTASSAVGKISSTATPPPRPPPPATAVAAANVGAVPRALSPTIGGVGGVSHGRPAAATATATAAAPGPPANKSAFDDLNDSIRMALGGSPSRPAPMVQQQAAMAAQQQPLQQQMPPAGAGMFSGMNDAAGQQSMMTGAPMVGYGIPTQAQVPVGYGSPAKQPMSGDGNAKLTHANCMSVTHSLFLFVQVCFSTILVLLSLYSARYCTIYIFFFLLSLYSARYCIYILNCIKSL